MESGVKLSIRDQVFKNLGIRCQNFEKSWNQEAKFRKILVSGIKILKRFAIRDQTFGQKYGIKVITIYDPEKLSI